MDLEMSEMAKMTSKGQITVPATIRNILNLKTGSTVLFKITENGILFVPCEIKEKNSYTQEEWARSSVLSPSAERSIRPPERRSVI